MTTKGMASTVCDRANPKQRVCESNFCEKEKYPNCGDYDWDHHG